jgi:hypothetical protein
MTYLGRPAGFIESARIARAFCISRTDPDFVSGKRRPASAPVTPAAPAPTPARGPD